MGASAGIGLWLHVFKLTCNCAVLSNALLFAHTSEYMRGKEDNVRWIAFTIFCCGIICLENAIDYALKDRPHWVKEAVGRQKSIVDSLVHGIDVLKDDTQCHRLKHDNVIFRVAFDDDSAATMGTRTVEQTEAALKIAARRRRRSSQID